jgi:hypothetical protein
MYEASLMPLVERWERIARRKFSDAELETDDMGKRLIEHGAICYSNCARDLRDAVQTRDASSDLDFEIVKQNCKRP